MERTGETAIFVVGGLGDPNSALSARRVFPHGAQADEVLGGDQAAEVVQRFDVYCETVVVHPPGPDDQPNFGVVTREGWEVRTRGDFAGGKEEPGFIELGAPDGERYTFLADTLEQGLGLGKGLTVIVT